MLHQQEPCYQCERAILFACSFLPFAFVSLFGILFVFVHKSHMSDGGFGMHTMIDPSLSPFHSCLLDWLLLPPGAESSGHILLSAIKS